MKSTANNYAFIDSQNLNLGVQSLGWKLDFKKFRVHLKENYHITHAFLFLGYICKYEPLYTALRSYGYELIFKPTVCSTDGITKGNVDAELVLHTVINLNNYDKALIVSGDGDFFCLVEYLHEHNKLLHIMIPDRYHHSSLFRPFGSRIIFLNDMSKKLGIKNSLPKQGVV